ncbi:hydrogenase maturation protease [Amycolatopsis decaplanina]|uniref:Hydrogenase maturation protease n=1 Tax=Amycolatopsis decaplanina DSM 44594 TaxID=1284240 RepID=M2Z2I7_9PSEU|nr:hydrogenase maturation protease [Amycolatopsis decaplanina]EME55073.1 hydrogenase maturation protease [Amycolatopsis decaplanina DSM 44594]
MNVLVIGVGNEFRRDDGVGPAVARAVARHGVQATISDGDTVRLMETWEGAELVIIVDAVRRVSGVDGRWHRTTLPQHGPIASSHGFGIPEAVELAEVLGRLPSRLVIFAVDVTDVGFGPGLTPAVNAAVPAVTEAVLAEISRVQARNPGQSP